MIKKDFVGQELAVGDTVAFYRPGYREFVLGKVIKFTPQKIKVEYQRHYGNYIDTYTEHSSNFIKINVKES